MTRAKKKILTEVEIKQLRRFIDNYADKDFYLSMIELLLFTGLRPKELTKIQIEDLHPDQERIDLKDPCKRGEPRLVPAPFYLLQRIVDQSLDSGLKKHDFFYKMISSSQAHFLDLLIEKWARIRLKIWGYGVYYSLYSFRHTKAVDVYRRSSGDILAVKMLLGHKSITSTVHYLKEINYEDYVKLYQNW